MDWHKEAEHRTRMIMLAFENTTRTRNIMEFLFCARAG